MKSFLVRATSAKLAGRRPHLVGALGLGLVWFLFAEPVWAQVANEFTTDVDKTIILNCKLPPEVRKFSSPTTTLIPGNVVELSRVECESRGGVHVESTVSDASPLQGKQVSTVTRAPSKASVMDAQKKLKDFGFDPGTPDGVMGTKTITALRRFQSERQLSATGKLDNPTILELKK